MNILFCPYLVSSSQNMENKKTRFAFRPLTTVPYPSHRESDSSSLDNRSKKNLSLWMRPKSRIIDSLIYREECLIVLREVMVDETISKKFHP